VRAVARCRRVGKGAVAPCPPVTGMKMVGTLGFAHPAKQELIGRQTGNFGDSAVPGDPFFSSFGRYWADPQAARFHLC